jgi:flagella basal body P-ring formation protein FlgA
MKMNLRKLLIGVVVVASARMGVAAEFKLRDEARVTKGTVLFGDLADIYNAEPAEAEKIAAVELIPAPPPGYRMRLTMREIQDFLNLRGVNLSQHQFSGAGEVSILRVSDSASTNLLHRHAGKLATQQARQIAAEAIIRYLREKVSDDPWQVDVTLDGEDAPLVARAAPTAVTGGESPWVGRQTFVLTVVGANGPTRVQAVAQVTLPAAVVVAIHQVPRGTVVRACDVQLQRLDADKAVKASFQTIEEVVGKEAQRNLTPGQMLDTASVRAPLLVHNGEVVTCYGRNAGIVVRLPARARENGSQGDLITVESLSDRRAILARVCGLQEVEVFGGASASSAAVASGESKDR